MKTSVLIVACVTLGSLALSAQAAKKKGPEPAPAPAGPAPAAGVTLAPGERLSQFLNAHLNEIVAPLDAKGFSQTQQLVDLKQAMADGLAQAEPAKKPTYQAAIAVCDALVNADAERQKGIASLSNSAAVHAPNEVGAIRKDHAGPVEMQREKQEQKQRNQQAAKTDSFFTTNQKNQWSTRAAQLREIIQQAYAQEREIERKSNVAPTAATPPGA